MKTLNYQIVIEHKNLNIYCSNTIHTLYVGIVFTQLSLFSQSTRIELFTMMMTQISSDRQLFIIHTYLLHSNRRKYMVVVASGQTDKTAYLCLHAVSMCCGVVSIDFCHN